MLKRRNVLRLTALFLLLIMILPACSKPAGPVEKSGKVTRQTLAGSPEIEYVICVGKNSDKAQTIVDSLNKVIRATDMNALVADYLDTNKRRLDDPAEKYDLKKLPDAIDVYTTVFEPYQFSGAFGNGVDGIDVILLFDMANDVQMRLTFHDEYYESAYESAKNGACTIFACGVALTDELKKDFLVTDVYHKGKLEIISDENMGYSKLEQLKGLRIGVLTGRTSYKVVDEAIRNGVLKNTGAELVAYNTDPEAGFALKNEMVDVLVLDELPANLIVARWK